MAIRTDGRTDTDLRTLVLTPGWLPQAEGSCLVELGDTRVIAAASVSDGVPKWLAGKGTGWVTAEYGMLPRATNTRNRRPANATQQSGRTMEIQRLIGRALRSVTDLSLLGERTVTIDCDVIVADGGTRTASIIGAAVALHTAGTFCTSRGLTQEHPMRELVAAISVGIHGKRVLVDLNYEEDSGADVDMNIVMTESGGLVEIQGTAEKAVFDRVALDSMTDAASDAIRTIVSIQKNTLGIT